jgi:hypothetical protein
MNSANMATNVAPIKYGYKNLVKEILALLIAIISVLLESFEVNKMTAINNANGIKVLA